jgi:protein-disulfide isomerase
MSHLIPSAGPSDHIRGALDAPVVLVEFGDFQCPYCGEMAGVVKAVQHAMGDTLAYVFRHFPLTELHAHALNAARFSEAAAKKGAFWEAHDMLFEHQSALSDEAIAQYAARLGVTGRELRSAFEGEYDERIESDFASGRKSGVNGTPSLFVNGEPYLGAHDTESLLARLVETARRS